ncbi:MAG: hypothetical protein IJ205_00315 [Bacteroidales bacterium]|nr:hypothetical protein [Bacteroidales bacterium]
MGAYLYIIASILLAGSLTVLRDLPVVNGSILASGAGERLSVRYLWPILMLFCLVLPLFIDYSPVSDTASGLFAPDSAGVVLPIGLATAGASLIAGLFCRYPAVPYAFIASLAGVSLALTGSISPSTGCSYILSWVAAPLLCALLAGGFYRLYALSLRNRTIHLAILDARLQGVSILASFLLLAAYSLNNSILFTYITKAAPVSDAFRASIAAGCALVLYPFMHKEVSMATWNLADYDLDINAQSISSVIISMAAVLLLFTSPLPAFAGMAATPLPVGLLFIAALYGISVARQRALVLGQEILKTLAASILSPVLALMFAYCLVKVMDGTPAGTVFVLVLVFLIAGGVFFFRWQTGKDLQKQILRSREQQVYSTQKSLSALEVKAEMTEKDLLNKLDLKRKELVDFALNIGDQKKFMEQFYEDLSIVRSLPDGEEKDARTDKLLSSLRERMYFTREINDFYARSEVLHRDFNLRLSEAYPNLTENEKKLANLLRQGFSSKYIASLMNITPKSVEINRYRLRSKLGLNRSDNLIKFIKSI